MKTSANGSEKYVGRCGSCPGFVMTEDNRRGLCHGEPPKPFVVPQKDATGKIMTDVHGQRIEIDVRLYAPVFPDVDWCFKHPWWQERLRTTPDEVAARVCKAHGVLDCRECAPHALILEHEPAEEAE